MCAKNKYLSCCCSNLFRISQQWYGSFRGLNSSILNSFSAFNKLLALSFEIVVIIVEMIVGIVSRGGGCPRWGTTEERFIVHVVLQREKRIIWIANVIVPSHFSFFKPHCTCRIILLSRLRYLLLECQFNLWLSDHIEQLWDDKSNSRFETVERSFVVLCSTISHETARETRESCFEKTDRCK